MPEAESGATRAAPRAGLQYGPPHLTTVGPMSGVSAGERGAPTGFQSRGAGADIPPAKLGVGLAIAQRPGPSDARTAEQCDGPGGEAFTATAVDPS